MLKHWKSWRNPNLLKRRKHYLHSVCLKCNSVLSSSTTLLTSLNKRKAHTSLTQEKHLTENAGADSIFFSYLYLKLIPQFKLLNVTLKEGSIGSIPEQSRLKWPQSRIFQLLSSSANRHFTTALRSAVQNFYHISGSR